MIVGIAKYNKGINAVILEKGDDYVVVRLQNGTTDIWCYEDFISKSVDVYGMFARIERQKRSQCARPQLIR